MNDEDKIFWRNEHRIGYWPPPNQYLENLPLADQIIINDGGPWTRHNVVCPVCGERGAIMDLNQGIFIPCDICRQQGWELKQKKRHWWNRGLRWW